jgi:hypothetical protein
MECKVLFFLRKTVWLQEGECNKFYINKEVRWITSNEEHPVTAHMHTLVLHKVIPTYSTSYVTVKF